MAFPSELEFVSFLQYSPRGISDISKQSKLVCHAVKHDGFIATATQHHQVIPVVAPKIAAARDSHEFLRKIFSPDTILVSAPRSSPLSARNALWPPLRICEELLKLGLAREIAPILERVTPVRKAATAQLGQRPTPSDHFESVRVVAKRPASPPRQVTLVDDVITQGSTFIGLYPHLRSVFPGREIHCFGLVRTVSNGEVERILAPTRGIITYANGVLTRVP
jgi:hypothetical protein